jgi:hypothetical protein
MRTDSQLASRIEGTVAFMEVDVVAVICSQLAELPHEPDPVPLPAAAAPLPIT